MARYLKVFQRVICALSALFAVSFALPGAASAADLLDVRFGPGADTTRIVFDVAGAPVFQVSGDDLGHGRIFVDFQSLEGATAAKSGMGHIAAVTFSKSGRNGVRAALEFKKTAKIKEVFVLEPSAGVAKHRLVIDLVTADKPAFLASLPSQYGDLTAVIEQVTADAGETTAPESTPELTAATPVQTASVPAPSVKGDAPQTAFLTRRKTVVIDAGHGGRDPGSIGQSGTLEKNVTFAAAKELAALLSARKGYNVVLTRDGDDTIRVDKREALAQKADADLFISLHADALGDNSVRGASVYTLSEEGTVRSMNLAKSEGNYTAYDLDLNEYNENDPVLGGILMGHAQKATLTNSSKLAELLIKNLTGKTPMLNRSHRRKNLRVLLATDVPAVLLEMAFISNVNDEANLLSPVWRKRSMTAVADSIDAYFEAEALQRQAQLGPAAGQ